MDVLSEPLPGMLELHLRAFDDNRGFFAETYNRRSLAEVGIDHEFVQDNESRSSAVGTIRGLHLQLAPHAQGKLVRVLRGAIVDVAVDLRPGSSTRLEHAAVELDADDGRLVWIPPGFAHGFCTLAPDTVVAYKVTDFYAPDTERTIRFDDPQLGISWPVAPDAAVLSDKDADAPGLAAIVQEIDA